jgi:exopolysaccharide biosynthesis polyprenyl glycosylphosphotransferase
MSHAWLWESSAVALALRDPALTNPSREVFAGQLIWGGEKRCALAFALLITMTTLFRCNIDITGIWLPCWGGIFAIFVAGSRWMVGACLEGLQRSGALREAVALIGADGPRGRLTRLIGSGADVVGVFNALPLGQMSESDIERLLDLGRVGALDTVLVAAENEAPSELALLIERLKVMPVEVVVSAGTKLQENPTSDLRILGNIQVAVVADCPIKRRDLLVKTSLDKAGALVILLLLAPLILAIAVAVGLTSEGKIIFKQTRQGWCGKSFTLWKFRTMHEPPDGSGWTRQTERNDARCTRVGRILRRTSLDELPQLWNVLCGEMSLVGPRPHADYLHRIDQVGREIMAVYAQRNRVKPGITGWAQIHGARGATENIEQLWQRLRYDLYYIEHWSLWLDLQILVRTVFCLFGENAY